MTVDLVHVFTFDNAGGNPCPVVCNADEMTTRQMQAVAQQNGHESGFVQSAPNGDFDYTFRFWVPNHEMEMCGHATVGALWLLSLKKVIVAPQVRISTLSGAVTGFISADQDGVPIVEITQPAGDVRTITKDAEDKVLTVLGLTRSELLDLPIQNAVTSRVKTIVPIKCLDRLNNLKPDFSAIESLCTEIGSTGLYPYAQHGDGSQVFDARQFPRSSGYPEDAATGIAATALSFGLLKNGLVEHSSKPIRVMQGRAMECLSQINVQLGFAGDRAIGSLVGGAVTLK